jgi:hypothetical protein
LKEKTGEQLLVAILIFIYDCWEYNGNTNFVAQEPEGSSLHSQQPATDLYPEPFLSHVCHMPFPPL